MKAFWLPFYWVQAICAREILTFPASFWKFPCSTVWGRRETTVFTANKALASSKCI